MSKYIVEESPPLRGTVKIGGSKNAVLPIMAAALLCPEECVMATSKNPFQNLTNCGIIKKGD